MHAEPRAVDVMLEAARRHPVARVRKPVAVLARADRVAPRGRRRSAAAIDDDPEIEVKKQAVFALSQLPADEGVPHLIRVARDEQATVEVRKQAMFWLGQSDDPRALAFFEEVLGR